MNDSDKKKPSDEESFQHTRKRMRAVADMLDILSRFEDPRDRETLMIAVVSTTSDAASSIMDEQMRRHYGKKP